MEFLKSQENQVVVIDIPNHKNEIETSKTEKKRKHVNFFKQFLIPRVYYTAIVVYILFMITNNIVHFLLVALNIYFEDGKSLNEEDLEEALADGKLKYIFVIYVVIIGPIIEELFFRLLLFRGISIIGEKIGKNNKFIRRFIKILAYLISSAVFAFGHFDFSFKVLMSDYVNFPIYFIMGIFFAIAYDYDGYFLAAILTHILNNAVATLLIFIL